MIMLKSIPPRYILLLLIPIIIPVLPLFFKDYIDRTVGDLINRYVEPHFKLEINYPEINLSYKDKMRINTAFIKNSLDVHPYKQEITSDKKIKEPPPEYKVNFIYIGINKKFVMINGKLFRENDRISKDERIIKIEKDRILLKGKWGERWIDFSR